MSLSAWVVSFQLWADDVIAGDDQRLDRLRPKAERPLPLRQVGAVSGPASSSSAIGPKTGTAMSMPSVRLQ